MSQETANSNVPELPPPETWREAADRSYDLLTAEGYRYEDPDTGVPTSGSHWIDEEDRTHQLTATAEGYVFRTLEHSIGPDGQYEASLEVAFTADGSAQTVKISDVLEYAGAPPDIRDAFALQQFGLAMNQAPGSPRYEQRAAAAVGDILDTIRAIGDMDGQDALADPMYHAEVIIPSGTGRSAESDSVRHRFDTIASLDTTGTVMMYAPSYSQVRYRTDVESGLEKYQPLRTWTLVAGGMVEYQDHLGGTNYVSPDPAHIEDMAAQLHRMHDQMHLQRTHDQMV